MGLFDGFEAGINSFKNKELKAVTDWVKDNTDLDNKVVEYVKNDPQKAAQAVQNPINTSLNQAFKLFKGKRNIGLLNDRGNEVIVNNVEPLGNNGPITKTIEEVTPIVTEAVEQGIKEANQPIWERESTVKILGEDGADKLQDTLNPARWGENAIDNLGISDTTKDNLKKYLPVAIAGGVALLLLSALK